MHERPQISLGEPILGESIMNLWLTCRLADLFQLCKDGEDLCQRGQGI